MTLPSLTAPTGTPVFLAAGHGIEEDSVYAVVPFAQGHSRQRRRWSVPERVVSVSWLLKAGPHRVVDQLAAVDRWFDETLQAGALEFAAQVANQGEGSPLLWWTAKWVEPIQTEEIPGGFGRVSGLLFLRGDGSEEGPVTGALEVEFSVALVGIPGNVSLPTDLEVEFTVALVSDYVDVTYATTDGDDYVTVDGDNYLVMT